MKNLTLLFTLFFISAASAEVIYPDNSSIENVEVEGLKEEILNISLGEPVTDDREVYETYIIEGEEFSQAKLEIDIDENWLNDQDLQPHETGFAEPNGVFIHSSNGPEITVYEPGIYSLTSTDGVEFAWHPDETRCGYFFDPPNTSTDIESCESIKVYYHMYQHLLLSGLTVLGLVLSLFGAYRLLARYTTNAISELTHDLTQSTEKFEGEVFEEALDTLEKANEEAYRGRFLRAFLRILKIKKLQ